MDSPLREPDYPGNKEELSSERGLQYLESNEKFHPISVLPNRDHQISPPWRIILPDCLLDELELPCGDGLPYFPYKVDEHDDTDLIPDIVLRGYE